MNFSINRALARLSTLSLFVAVLVPATALGAARVHIRGTAYEFNNVKARLAGASIRVVEFPKLKATPRANGSFDLLVPAKARITPYITMKGFSRVHLQTFTMAGKDLANVNFQTPRVDIARALGFLLGVPVSATGQPAQCVIVSTFSTKNVRNLKFEGFTGYGAHGIAGATARTFPMLPGPTYFNEDVIPDPGQLMSSKDGGVLWKSVPAGVYKVTAKKPGNRFASFTATCKPGRIVNANPPWGLFQTSGPGG